MVRNGTILDKTIQGLSATNLPRETNPRHLGLAGVTVTKCWKARRLSKPNRLQKVRRSATVSEIPTPAISGDDFTAT